MTGPTVVLSHLGVDADRVLSPPKGSIILGAHDHRRIITPTLAHSGAYGEGLTVAKYYARRGLDTDWTTEWRPTGAKRDEALAARLAPLQRHLTANDKRCVGVNQKAMGLKAAAQWAVEQLRQTTGADLAVLNHTSFGSGLPKGPISAYRWRRFLRFDNALKIGPLRAPPADPAGDRDPSAADRDPAARLALSARLHVSAAKSGRFPFRVATSDWVASKADRYFGTGRSGPFEAIGGPRLRARLAARLAPCPP